MNDATAAKEVKDDEIMTNVYSRLIMNQWLKEQRKPLLKDCEEKPQPSGFITQVR